VLSSVRKQQETVFLVVAGPPVDLREQLVLEQKITQANIRYQKQLNAYKDFLKTNRSENNQRDMETSSALSNIRRDNVFHTFENIILCLFCKGPDSCVRNSQQGVLRMICVMNTHSC
jgi:hypothetical protein